jgi:hypothetical protein
MKTHTANLRTLAHALIYLLASAFCLRVEAQGTAFTYQGRLNDGANPANGSYDLKFTLLDAPTNNNVIAGPTTNTGVGVSNGLFTLTLDAGPGPFNGQRLWVEIGARTNGNGSFATLAPRQQITPSPYAIYSFNANNAAFATNANFANNAFTAQTAQFFSIQLAGDVNGPQTNTVVGKIQGTTVSPTPPNPGQVLVFNSGSWTPLTPPVWSLNGNAGTTAGANYLGTPDNQPLELHVNGARALRLEPTPGAAPNVIGGASLNAVANSVIGGTIGGGTANSVVGYFGTVAGGTSNSASAWATVSGGTGNMAGGGDLGNTGTNNSYATVGGGFENTASLNATVSGGQMNSATGLGATVGGGNGNTANGDSSTVGGGDVNTASYLDSTVGGGGGNKAIAVEATVAGGYHNLANGIVATISGGQTNIASGYYSTVGGGSTNLASGTNATVGGGSFNTASNYNATVGGGYQYTAGAYATVPGGFANTAGYGSAVGGGSFNTAGNYNATVGGGFLNSAGGIYSTVPGGFTNTASADYSTVGGGQQNTASGLDYSTVAGGFGNTASGSAPTVGGGYQNTANGNQSTVAGGNGNTASGVVATVAGGQSNAASGDFSIVGGGGINAASGAFATVGGGYSNTVSADYGTIPGGDKNVAANKAFAAGHRAKATYRGSFVWADSNDFDFSANIEDKVRFRCTGGFDIITGIDGAGNTTSAVFVPPGGSGWSSVSDRNAKEDFQQADVREVLDAVAALPMSTWKYKTQAGGIRHMGPMAQDFYAAFKIGEDEKHINNIDEEGVALAAIQGLNQKLDEKDAEIKDLRQTVDDLKKLVQSLAEKK